MSRNRPVGAAPARRSARRGIGARLVTLVAVLAAVLAATVIAAAPASAAASCTHQTFTHITGLTRNETRFGLTRSYLEKGAINSWGDEPAPALRPHALDQWCAGTPLFGTAMKVSYRVGYTGIQVNFEAWRYGPGPYGARCSLDGPDAATYRCSTEILRVSSQSIFVVFVLEPVR